MKTWDDCKEHIRTISPEDAAEIPEIETLSAIISQVILKRTNMGISQRELAAMCNMPQSSIARIEACKTIPKLDTLLRLMKPLGLNLRVAAI